LEEVGISLRFLSLSLSLLVFSSSFTLPKTSDVEIKLTSISSSSGNRRSSSHDGDELVSRIGDGEDGSCDSVGEEGRQEGVVRGRESHLELNSFCGVPPARKKEGGRRRGEREGLLELSRRVSELKRVV